MAVHQLIWIVLIGAVLIVGFPVKSPDTVNEEDRLNYEKYVRQLEKKHKFAYNDIDQPWQPISDDDSAEDGSHEIVLKPENSVSVQPLVKDNVKLTSQSPVVLADQAPVTPVIKAEEIPAVPVIKAEEIPAIPVIKTEETPAVPVSKTEETPAVPVTKTEEIPAVPVIKTEETPAVPVTKAEETPAVPVIQTEETPAVPVIKAEETPAVPVIQTEEIPAVPVIKAEETPAVPVTKAEETPAVPVIQTEEILAVSVIKAEEAPAVPVTKTEETPAVSVTETEETPAVPVTKAEEVPVVAPVTEAGKEQQVADAISEIVAAVAEDEVATTTHEKLLASSDIEDDVPATTTHEKLLGVADEVEASGQSDAAVAEEESVTVIHSNEPIEDSTAFSALKTDLDVESVTKVADDSDVNEGSGQPLSDSVTNSADQGSGGQPLSDSADEGSGQPQIENAFADEGSGAADSNTEGSGLADELIKEIDHTIQPEISNEESSTGTHFDLHLKDALAFDSPSATTEFLTTDVLNEKEVKSTDIPTADEIATTEIQPSPTIKSAQAEDSTEVVIADSTDAINGFRQVSAATSDSTDHPVEDTTSVNVPVNDEILADETLLKNTTEKPDDSHSTPSDV